MQGHWNVLEIIYNMVIFWVVYLKIKPIEEF